MILAQQSYKRPDSPRRGNTVGSGVYHDRLAALQQTHPDGNRKIDLERAAAYASGSAGDMYSGVFKNAVTYMQQAQRSADGEDEVDEEQAIEAHQWLYHHHQAARSLDARSIGAAAAIQAYNQFLIHGGPPSRPSNIHLDSQSQVIGMAMAEAVRLFDSTAGGTAGSQQDAVNASGSTAIKLITRTQQMSGKAVVASNGGGTGSLARWIKKICAHASRRTG